MIGRHRFALWAALGGAVLATAGCGTGGMEHLNTADKTRGKMLFQQTCAACHTLADAGTTGTIGPNLDDAFSGPRAQGFAESTIANVVRDQILFANSEPVGVVTLPGGTTQRAPGMPAMLLRGQDAQDVAAYVASVAGIAEAAALGGSTEATTTTAAPVPAPPPAATTTTSAAPAPAGGGSLVAQGKSVFASAGCASCHTLKDAGATGTVGPNLDQLKPSEARVAKQVTNGGAIMPSFKDKLTPAQIKAVATYVSSVAGT